MTRQEEIDNSLIEYARAVAEVGERELMTNSMMRKEWGKLLVKVKQDLSALGVVIKAKGGLPKFFCNYGHLAEVRSGDGCIAVVEPLVEK